MLVLNPVSHTEFLKWPLTDTLKPCNLLRLDFLACSNHSDWIWWIIHQLHRLVAKGLKRFTWPLPMQSNSLLPVFCSIMIPLSPVYHDWGSKTIQAALLVYLMSPLPLVSFERGEFQRFGGIFLFFTALFAWNENWSDYEVSFPAPAV